MQLLFCAFCFLYAYFFQGGGWNQNSQFDAVRSLVERHTLEITPMIATVQGDGTTRFSGSWDQVRRSHDRG